MLDINLRSEAPGDYHQTENITREAFWNRYAPGSCEHYLVHTQRKCPAFVPELDLVAAQGETVVGNVICIKGKIMADDGRELVVLTLGPLTVLPGCQGQGVGSRLLKLVKERAREMGFRAILLYGDPAYYSRQGFVPAETLHIRTPDDMYADALQVCELYENALAGAAGRYLEDPVYEVDEAAAEEFDKAFPKKEKEADTPAQKRFQELVVLRKKAL